MRRFFDRADTHWRQLEDCLHVYAVPAEHDPIRAEFTRMGSALAAVPGLGSQPEKYMHATVQRFDAFAADLADHRWENAVRQMAKTIAGHSPMELVFGPPQARSHAVEAVGEPSQQWSSLIAGLREVVVDCGLADVLTQAPYAPHYSVSYCLADTPDEPVRGVLGRVAAPTRFQVDQVKLVAVGQDREAGVFHFRTVSTWPMVG